MMRVRSRPAVPFGRVTSHASLFRVEDLEVDELEIFLVVSSLAVPGHLLYKLIPPDALELLVDGFTEELRAGPVAARLLELLAPFSKDLVFNWRLLDRVEQLP